MKYNKRIVFLDQYGSLGGGQQVLLELVLAAQALFCDVAVIIPKGSCADRLTSMGVHVENTDECRLTCGTKSFFDILRFVGNGLRVFFQKLKLLKTADVIYVNGNRLLPVALLSMIFLNKKAAFHIHLNHTNLEKSIFSRVIMFRNTAAVVAPSEFIRDQLCQFSPHFNSPKLRLVENGLDSRFTQVAFKDRFSDRPIRHIGIVGRISPEKGQDVLPALARQFSDLTFHVLGDAAFSEKTYEDRLRAESPANVVFHGWVENLPAKVDEIGLQVCIIPSRCPEATPGRSFEAAPLVPLQQIAMGCMVAVRSLGSLEYIARDLSLPSFHEDQDIPGCLQSMLQTPAAELARQCRQRYDTVMAQHCHAAFQQRLRALLAGLCGVRDTTTR
ncbi:glycosyltransferase [Desulfovibrio desulfuricans]|uniref:Glycosyltransferase n=1 Tax=Desulfovibrio desulfuricans TaxID=876 RepID=A0A4P7UMN8_DESDE|nr:glycosyltransferase family 4 protein [Desulfovibrio desulfuricans]QCC84772.1 glycosyltransferase [Desulfovibrio desulfuricans]